MKRMRRNNREAFTLAELLVVVAIIAIIAAIGIIQLANARKDLQVKANDSNAKLIYLAAQNQLLQMKEFGQWDALLKSKTTNNGLDRTFFGNALASPGHATNVLSEVEEENRSALKPSDYEAFYVSEERPTVLKWDTVQNDMCVAEYMPEENAIRSGVIANMLPLGTVEDGVRTQGRYIIEYDVRTASVYGVFYTEDESLNYVSDSFTSAFYGDAGTGRPYGDYNGVGGLVSGISETAARRVRRDYTDGDANVILGYFGGSMAYGLDYSPLEIPEVRIDNGEELILHIKDPNSYEVNDETKIGSDIQIIVAGKTKGGSVTYNLVADTSEPSGYYLSGSMNNHASLVKSCTVAEDGISYEIVLDSITPGPAPKNENWHFAKNFCNQWNTPADNNGVVAGDDIEITVLITPHISNESPRVALPVSRTVETNSLFADAEFKNNTSSITHAKIAQIRHLENLETSISGAKFTNGSDNTLVVDFENSVSFDGHGDGLLSIVPKNYTGLSITRKNGNSITAYTEGSFIPVNFTSGINLEVNGNGCNIYNIGFQLTRNGYGTTTTTGTTIGTSTDISVVPVDGSDTSRVPDSAEKILAAGLFGSIGGHLKISGLGIVNSRTAKEDESVPTKLYRTVFVGNADAMGAFAGHVGGTAELNGCWSTVQLKSNNAVKGASIGGLVGNVAGNVAINYCYVSGRTAEKGKFSMEPKRANLFVNANAKNVNVGGLIGNCSSASVIGSYCNSDIGITTPSTAGHGLPEAQKPTYKVGGLAGNVAKDIKIGKSYFAGWINLPVSIEPREDHVLYGGFVGDCGMKEVEADQSFWIKEFLGISNLEENDKNGDFGLLLAETPRDETEPSFPYDCAWLKQNYVYPNVTGLKHHWGDWCVEQPDIGLYFIPGAGIGKVVPDPDRPTELRYYETYNDDGILFLNVPADVICDLDETVDATLLEGFEGVKYYYNGDEEIQPYDTAAPGELPGNLTNGHFYFVTTGKSAVIYVRAEKLLDPDLAAIGSVTKVFNYEDTLVTPSIRNYDSTVTVRKFLAYSFDANKLPTTVEQRTSGIRVKLPGASTYTQYAPDNTYEYLIDTSLDPESSDYSSTGTAYTIEKDSHYGTLYCRVFVFAYYDEDVAGSRPALYSDVASRTFTVTLTRVPVTFKHATGYGPYANWSLNGGTSDVTYYIEYNDESQGVLYSSIYGTSYLQPTHPDTKIYHGAGNSVSPPSVSYAAYYDNAFGLESWALPDSTGNGPDSGKKIYSANGNGYSLVAGLPYNANNRFIPTDPDDTFILYPIWDYIPMPIGIDPGPGGYWETLPAPAGGGT